MGWLFNLKIYWKKYCCELYFCLADYQSLVLYCVCSYCTLLCIVLFVLYCLHLWLWFLSLCWQCTIQHLSARVTINDLLYWIAFNPVMLSNILSIWMPPKPLVPESYCFWVCPCVSLYKLCEHYISKNQWRELQPILVTYVFGFIDVLIRFWVQRVSGHE